MDSLGQAGTMAGMENQPGFSLTHEERVALTFIAHNDPRDGFVRRTWLEFKTAICGLLQRTRGGGWIPVSERLPEEGVEVLWYSSHDRFAQWAVGKREGRSVDWGGDLSAEIDGWLTHWMPLPEPPAEYP